MRDVFKILAVFAITALAVFAAVANGFLTGVVIWFGLLILSWIVERSVEQRAKERRLALGHTLNDTRVVS